MIANPKLTLTQRKGIGNTRGDAVWELSYFILRAVREKVARSVG